MVSCVCPQCSLNVFLLLNLFRRLLTAFISSQSRRLVAVGAQLNRRLVGHWKFTCWIEGGSFRDNRSNNLLRVITSTTSAASDGRYGTSDQPTQRRLVWRNVPLKVLEEREGGGEVKKSLLNNRQCYSKLR